MGVANSADISETDDRRLTMAMVGRDGDGDGHLVGNMVGWSCHRLFITFNKKIVKDVGCRL